MIAPKTGGREHVFFMKYTWQSKSAPRPIGQASGGILTPFLERFYERLRDAFISHEQHLRHCPMLSAFLTRTLRPVLAGGWLARASTPIPQLAVNGLFGATGRFHFG